MPHIIRPQTGSPRDRARLLSAHPGRRTLIGIIVVVATMVGACGESETESTGEPGRASETLTLLTHQSYAVSEGIIEMFEAEHGVTVEILRSDDTGFVLAEKPYVVVVGLADKKLGLNVDRFLGQEEVVIKSLGTHLRSTEGVAGATILGDGRIRLIIDVIGLFNLTRKGN